MSKKKINKIKTKQKQRQKQMQIVNVNIHKPSRKPREGPSQPRRNILPTPQYIYTSQTDNLVPQMFNKEGKQEAMPTLTEQINKSLDEKINKLVSQYTKPAATQPSQQDVRTIRTEQYNNKPNIREKISEYGKNKPKKEAPIIFKQQPDTPLTNVQNELPITNEPILVKSGPVNIYNTIAKSRTTSGFGSDGGFEQKSGFSVKQGSGYQSESGYKSESSMTPEQKAKMKQARINSFLPNKPEEKIPSLIESIKPFDKPVQVRVAETNDQKVEEFFIVHEGFFGQDHV